MKTNNDLPWFPFYCNDFLAKTRGLTTEEVGALILLDAYFWENGPIPNNTNVIKRITGNVDASSVIDQFFQTDSEGRLFDPYMVGLKEKAIDGANKNRARTQKATQNRWKRNGQVTDNFSVTQNSSVTETDTESYTDTDSDTYSHSDLEPNSPAQSVTDRLTSRFGTGRTTNGTGGPPSGPGTPQTSVTEASQAKPNAQCAVPLSEFAFLLSSGKLAPVRSETIAQWKAQYHKANVETIVRTWANRSMQEPFDNAEHVRETLLHYIDRAHQKLIGSSRIN